MAAGGGSRSRYWLAAVATALRIPIDVPETGEIGAAFGAARLGLIAAGKADPGNVCAAPSIAATIEPSTDLSADYEAAYERYRELYPMARGHAALQRS